MSVSLLQLRLYRLGFVLAFTMVGCSQKAPPTLIETLRDSCLANVKARLEQGANVDEQDSKGRTLLHAAAYHGDFESVTYLIERGANPNLLTMAGFTPLHAAVFKDNA